MSLNQWLLVAELEDISNCLNGYFERVLAPPCIHSEISIMADWTPGFAIFEANLDDLPGDPVKVE
ncbi:MAG: hypothetical protein HOP04_04075 [Methylophilaceae bacterium]|nr:hypothetical protein [Methylophilaceae bacterium]